MRLRSRRVPDVVRRVVALAVLVASATACGDGDDGVAAGTSTTVSGAFGEASSGDGQLATVLTVDPDPPVAGAEVTWRLRVENIVDEAVRLRFASGQRAEVSLLTGDREAWRWGAGRVFVQVLGDETIRPGEALTIEMAGPLDVEPGTYEVAAELRADRPVPAISGTVRVVGAG